MNMMTKAWKDMSAIPTSKPLVYSFTLFLMTMMTILLIRGRDIPHNITSLLSIMAPAIYGGYFVKSGYEHRVNMQYGGFTEPSFIEHRDPNMETGNESEAD